MRSMLQELVANSKPSNNSIFVLQAKVTEERFDPKAGTKEGRNGGNGHRNLLCMLLIALKE